MVDYTLKMKWDSLSALKKRIDEDKKSKEKVVSFDGMRLVTNKFIYTLYDGQLSRTNK